jgi:hypothetical protein
MVVYYSQCRLLDECADECEHGDEGEDRDAQISHILTIQQLHVLFRNVKLGL